MSKTGSDTTAFHSWLLRTQNISNLPHYPFTQTSATMTLKSKPKTTSRKRRSSRTSQRDSSESTSSSTTSASTTTAPTTSCRRMRGAHDVPRPTPLVSRKLSVSQTARKAIKRLDHHVHGHLEEVKHELERGTPLTDGAFAGRRPQKEHFGSACLTTFKLTSKWRAGFVISSTAAKLVVVGTSDSSVMNTKR
eukprot:m.57122 g.57122  ORF g.57122 m.57122 type:complete len:192 (+) comp12700_c0_seq1:59-634(+)